MERLDKRVAGSLTRFYVVALCVVALLTMSGLFLIRRTIRNLNHDSRVVNVAGRQRMLSQRLTKLAILRINGLAHKDSVDFDSLLQLWKNSNENLVSRKLQVGQGVVTWKSPPLDTMFRELAPIFNRIYTNLRIIHHDSSGISEKQQALAEVLESEPEFLHRMDRIVFQFDKESYERLENLERIEWILDLMTILVLIAEGLLIFRPVVNTTRRVVRMLTESEDALQLSNQKLKEANSQLVETQRELLRLEEEKYEMQLAEDRVRAGALIEGQEEERKRFALELHDGIGQMLTGLKLHAEKLKAVQFHDEKNQKRFDQLVVFIQDIIQTTRQISFNLMPSVLSDFGLASALKLLCQQTAEVSGIRILFEGETGARIPMARPMEIGLYRIAQEALNNAVKHANADQIKIKLEQSKNRIVLEIADDGKGFLISNLKSEEGQFLTRNGMENIRTRTQLLNGQIEIISKVDSGTKLVVQVDL
ncbi:ATP-binding protein [Dyadobacter sp. CY261]|uniref:ATP-binding protein n=1 Tax=Dyadobacter sp. CY261 TaxID=2907203 RepID=UPI001F43EBF9|nr:ATP-binding protein [Dyadobacter sp. CY261]MCF0073873.1 ATP-binding protein [Dyadobacter sp. CY261]